MEVHSVAICMLFFKFNLILFSFAFTFIGLEFKRQEKMVFQLSVLQAEHNLYCNKNKGIENGNNNLI